LRSVVVGLGWRGFNATASQAVPGEITQALDWIANASLPVAALEEPDTVRAALNACARRLDGKPAAATTTRRKRAVFANALGYAVERRLLPANPSARSSGKPPKSPRPSTAARSSAPPRPAGS
jgi:hypothetical protein